MVCDGCGSGASSEVGARLGARLVLAALEARLVRGASPADATVWAEVRAEVGAALAQIAALLNRNMLSYSRNVGLNFGRLTALRDLPPKRELVAVVKQAVS